MQRLSENTPTGLTGLGQLLSDPNHYLHQPVHTKTALKQIDLLMGILKLHNSGLSESSVTELLKLIKDILGDIPNNVPDTFSQVKGKLQNLMVEPESYQICRKGSIVPRSSSCECCGQEEENCTTFHYIPLIPRLKQLFEVEHFAKIMTEQKHAVNIPNTYRDIYDGQKWQNAYNKPQGVFYSNPQAVSLVTSSDGTQPFHHIVRRGSYSMWVFASVIANLPPTLRESLILLNGIVEGMLDYIFCTKKPL